MSNVSEQFLNGLTQLTNLEDDIKRSLQTTQQIRNKKEQLEKKLIKYMKDNNLHDSSLNFQDNRFYIGKDNTYTNLSFKFIEDKLKDIIPKEQIPTVITHLKDCRDKQSTEVIKIGKIRKKTKDK
jgi:hypothetical protein